MELRSITSLLRSSLVAGGWSGGGGWEEGGWGVEFDPPTASRQRLKPGWFALLSLALGTTELGKRLAG